MKHGMIRIWVLVFLFAAAATAARAEELPEVKPSAVGMSGEKLAKVDAAIDRLIAGKRLAGAVVVVARHGKVGATQ